MESSIIRRKMGPVKVKKKWRKICHEYEHKAPANRAARLTGVHSLSSVFHWRRNCLQIVKLEVATIEKLKLLKGDIERGVAKTTRKYYVSLPTVEAHHSTRPTGGIYGMTQKVHPKLVEKIHQLVSEGVTGVSEMKRALGHYVKYDLCWDSPPDPNDRAYHPSKNDIKNHIHRAKSRIQLSKIDQVLR